MKGVQLDTMGEWGPVFDEVAKDLTLMLRKENLDV